MGKKTRKTRWRTLAIASGEQSDSEESSTHPGQHATSKLYSQQKPYYSKFPYSSQSTPIRNRFQNDAKSTRSSSTTSENKITFNEDEYTRITTPRQDVLFKKGYLSKPKTYQTQTSTGNSTISTGNSTGNGTPDHQSADGTEGTDLEYESQFVFPNGFVDQNGIYYINSYEPYPHMVVYNAPYCYPECPPTRCKRYSTDSLTESTSPHNEETSQDLSHSGGETANVSEIANPVFSAVYTGYCYENGTATATEMDKSGTTSEPRKIKKRRRRKLSKPVPEGTSSDECESDEAISEIENRIIQGTHRPTTASPTEEKPEDASVAAEEKTDHQDNVAEVEAPKTCLKPDAKEFVPRSYQVEPHHGVQFVGIPPSFIPLPLAEMPPGFHPAFLPPPGIPINFIPPDPKMVHNYVNFIPALPPKAPVEVPNEEPEVDSKPIEVEEPKQQSYKKNNIDIAKIVSKLEEAAKEQRLSENRKSKFSPLKFNKQFNKPRFAEQKQVRRTNNFRRQEAAKVEAQENVAPTRKEVEAVKLPERPAALVNNVNRPNETCSSVKATKPNYAETVQKRTVKVTPETPKIVAPKPVISNQWISVSSRKKRKNKVTEEEVEVAEEVAAKQDDDFESYDVSLLEDVVVPPPTPPKSPLPEDNKDVPEAPAAEDPVVVEEKEEDIPVEPPKECEEIDLLIKSLEEIEAKTANLMKKGKKSAAKSKRIMITDTVMVEPTVEKKPAEPKPVPKPAEAKPKVEESPDKKRGKKKKKPLKAKTLSNSSSCTTLNNLDDSYDFLINESLMEDEKTNVEISEELDKIIQRGMYSSLEEKIKSLNITAANDGFFKTLSVQNSKAKTNDLSAALLNTTNIFKPKRPSVDEDLGKLQLPDLQPSTTGSFLDVANVQKDPGIADGKTLYPITTAVKEWMSKTRENTPEVELLKSPSTILRELKYESDGEDVTVFSTEDWSVSPQNSFDGDLLDCWEDDVKKVDVAEDVLEVYESQYGRNEDYVRIKAEIDEKKRNGTFPKHANLPYRAICCSLM